MFLTGTLVFNNGDHAEFRPVVVVRAPQRSEDLLTTIQRSSTATWQRGIDHPADRSLGLTLDGRWVLDYQRSARCDHFWRRPTGSAVSMLSGWTRSSQRGGDVTGAWEEIRRTVPSGLWRRQRSTRPWTRCVVSTGTHRLTGPTDGMMQPCMRSLTTSSAVRRYRSYGADRRLSERRGVVRAGPEAAVRNHFRMAARRTDSGAVLRALTHAVDNDRRSSLPVQPLQPEPGPWPLTLTNRRTPAKQRRSSMRPTQCRTCAAPLVSRL